MFIFDPSYICPLRKTLTLGLSFNRSQIPNSCFWLLLLDMNYSQQIRLFFMCSEASEEQLMCRTQNYFSLLANFSAILLISVFASLSHDIYITDPNWKYKSQWQPVSLLLLLPQMKPEPVTAIGAKASPIQPPKTTQPPLTGIGNRVQNITPTPPSTDSSR